MKQRAFLFLASIASAAPLNAAITETFDTYPTGGSGWPGNWIESSSANNVDGTLSTASPLNGGGSYLSVTNTSNSTNLGLRRAIGTATTSSVYTLTFDWRLDTPLDTFTSFNDRVHIGSNSDGATGTGTTWGWIIGVGAGNNGTTNTVFPGNWYFYNNQSTSANGAFDSADMLDTEIALQSGVTYSFSVTVDSAARTYNVVMTDGTTTFDSATKAPGGMNFRNQTSAGTSQTSLVWGGAVSASVDGPLESLTFSLDNINIVPEPSTALLTGLAGLLCFVRRRIVH